ncbi:hypothetical protein DUT91_01425 [Phyllobacterium salinisoli]|uniref:Uncharacterized protein n=1 Tax=Phyllobacterium salinisoli TaxID=1899321 RepID=A0A368K809_9HYPH|nr:hypothetical protein [Phyllobacterium salinisoli]RCS25489.1 hypothetical protein DUT91_01425 [Phyllobacterium salinisoli]
MLGRVTKKAESVLRCGKLGEIFSLSRPKSLKRNVYFVRSLFVKHEAAAVENRILPFSGGLSIL